MSVPCEDTWNDDGVPIEIQDQSETHALSLFSYQKPCFKRMIDIMAPEDGSDGSHICINTTVPGGGKTVMAHAWYYYGGFSHCIVVCPSNVKSVWTKMEEKTGVKYSCILSYNELRGTEKYHPLHNLLRRGTRKVGEMEKPWFSPTKELRTFIKEGLLVILDEFHYCKNESAQSYAVNALIDAVRDDFQDGTKSSRVLGLTGTAIDKIEHTVNLFRHLGLFQQDELVHYNQGLGTWDLLGLQEVIDACRSYDRAKTKEIMASIQRTPGFAEKMCYSFFTEIIRQRFFCMCVPPENKNATFDVKNGYYDCDNDEETDELVGAVQDLARASKFAGENHLNPINRRIDVRVLMRIEAAKINIFVRLAKKRLDEDPKNRVILLLNYIDNILEVGKRLRTYNPVFLYGQTDAQDRLIAQDKFESGESRLFIGGILCCANGLNLQDKVGDAPRFTYASTMFYVSMAIQASYRAYRADTMSNVNVRWVYGNIASRESRIMDAILRKSIVLKSTFTVDDSEFSLRLPCDYEEEKYDCKSE